MNTELTDPNLSIYTGVAYIVTVILLILPYMLAVNYFLCLGLTLCTALQIIFFFNFYVSVAKDYSLKRRFLEMADFKLGACCVNFCDWIINPKDIGKRGVALVHHRKRR